MADNNESRHLMLSTNSSLVLQPMHTHSENRKICAWISELPSCVCVPHKHTCASMLEAILFLNENCCLSYCRFAAKRCTWKKTKRGNAVWVPHKRIGPPTMANNNDLAEFNGLSGSDAAVLTVIFFCVHRTSFAHSRSLLLHALPSSPVLSPQD